MKIRRKNLYQKMAFALGLFSSTDIVYLFSIGSTPIQLIYLFSALSIVLLVLLRKNVIKAGIRLLSMDLKLFYSLCIVSLFPTVMVNVGHLYHWLTGCIMVTLFYSVILLSSYLAKYKLEIFKGIIFGVFISICVDIVRILYLASGNIFDISIFFPAYKSAITYVYNKPSLNRITLWGMFKEFGYYCRYLAITCFLMWQIVKRKSKFWKMFYIAVFAVLIAYTRSSSTFSLLLGLALYYVLNNVDKFRINRRLLWGIIIIPIVFFVQLKSDNSFFNLISSNLMGIFNLKEAGNSNRMLGITFTLRMIWMYLPLGCGWNSFHACFVENGFYGYVGSGLYESVMGSYSGALQIICEMGIFSMPLFYFFINKIITLVKLGSDYHKALACSLFVSFFVMITTNFMIEPILAVLFGLVIAEIREAKSNRRVAYEEK